MTVGKLGDQLRREQEQEAAAEVDKIVSGGPVLASPSMLKGLISAG